MATNNQTSAQQSKALSLTIFLEDGSEVPSFFRYDSEAQESVPVAITTIGVADAVLPGLLQLGKRSSGDNGQVVRAYAKAGEFQTLVNGDVVVSNLHYSKFQPAGLQQ